MKLDYLDYLRVIQFMEDNIDYLKSIGEDYSELQSQLDEILAKGNCEVSRDIIVDYFNDFMAGVEEGLDLLEQEDKLFFVKVLGNA